MSSNYRWAMDQQFFARGHGLEMPSWGKMQAVFPNMQGLCFTPSSINEFLESKMRRYAEYAELETRDNGEKLVPIQAKTTLVARQIGEDMRPFTGDQVYVREQVLERLQTAGTLLGKVAGNAQLEVVYGYRALSIQTALFEHIKGELVEQGFAGSQADLLEAVHRMVAVPDVAGHPTGGAVDIQMLEDGAPMNMGTPIWEFVKDSYTFSPYISNEAWNNRQVLRDVMVEAGFVPFDGEWWHFSYGDPEWAAATGEPYAIYDQVEFKI